MANDRQPIRNLFEEVDNKIGAKRWVALGIISDTRASDKRVRVQILPTLKETNWIRLQMFNGLGSGTMPKKDSCVLLLFVDGHDDGAICLSGNVLDEGDGGNSGALDISFYDAYGNSLVMKNGGIYLNNGSSLQGAVRKNDVIQSPLGPCVVQTASQSVFIGG